MTQHSRMMAEHFGISILESDARLLHERIQLLITEAYNRGVQREREGCAQMCDDVDKESQSQWPKRFATMIRARGNP